MLSPLSGALGPLGSGVAPTGDADAAAFIAAAALTDPTQISAVTALVTALKGDGLWTKIHAAYPFVGGTAFCHKWNLKDPRDLDASFRLSFNGTWVHNANGITGDQATAYADTHFVPATNYPGGANDASLGLYNRLDLDSPPTPYDMGCSNSSDTQAVICISKYTNNQSYFGLGTSGYVATVAVADGRGFFVSNRLSVTNTQGYRNGVAVVDAGDDADFPPVSIFIGASNHGGSPTYFSNKNWSFAFMADGFTGTEVAALYSAVQAYQTTLGRQV